MMMFLPSQTHFSSPYSHPNSFTLFSLFLSYSLLSLSLFLSLPIHTLSLLQHTHTLHFFFYLTLLRTITVMGGHSGVGEPFPSKAHRASLSPLPPCSFRVKEHDPSATRTHIHSASHPTLHHRRRRREAAAHRRQSPGKAEAAQRCCGGQRPPASPTAAPQPGAAVWAPPLQRPQWGRVGRRSSVTRAEWGEK